MVFVWCRRETERACVFNCSSCVVYLSSTPDEDHGLKVLVFLIVLYDLSSTPDEDHGLEVLVFSTVLSVIV